MYNYSSIVNGLFSFIGFKNTINPNEITLDPTSDLLSPESGIFYNEDFKLLELQTIQSVSPFFQGYNLTDSEVSVNFTNFLETKVKSWVNKCLSDLVTEKKLNLVTKTILADGTLYQERGNRRDSEVKRGRFVGMDLKLLNQQNTKFIIEKIGAQFSEPQTDLPIYLYHSSVIEPLETRLITTTKTTSFEWLTLSSPLELDYYSDLYNTGGSFRIGYYEQDLTGNAINYSMCNYCGGGNTERKKYSKILKAYALSVQDVNYDTKEQWELGRESITDKKTYGINLKFKAHCDITDLVLNNKEALINLLLISAKVWICEEIINASRQNEYADKLRPQAIYNLSEEGLNLKKQYKDKIKELDFDLSDLGSLCCPDKKKKMVSYGSIGV